MSLIAKKAFIILTVAMVALMVTNPSERYFLTRVSEDFGTFHQGVTLSEKQLLEMGTSHRRSFLFFSLYDYEFGNIGVSYFGIGLNAIYLDSYSSSRKQSNGMVRS